MKASTKTVVFVITLTTFVALFSLGQFSQKDTATELSSVSEASSLAAQNKAQIISIVSGGAPLSSSAREKLFASLSGPNMLRYNFTQAEKILIVKALNTPIGGKQSTKKSSSARSDITRFSGMSVFSNNKSVFLESNSRFNYNVELI
jgi:hypothetical protein